MPRNSSPYHSSLPSRLALRASVIRPRATQHDEYGLSRYVTVAELPALLPWTHFLSVSAQATKRGLRSRLTHSSVTSFVGTSGKHGKHHSDVRSYSHTPVLDPDFIRRTPGFNTQLSFSNSFAPAFTPQSAFTTPQENSGSSGHLGPDGFIPLPPTVRPPSFAGAVRRDFSAAPGQDAMWDRPGRTMHDHFVLNERAVAAHATSTHNLCGSHAGVSMSTSDHPGVNHVFAAMTPHASAACSVADNGFRAQASGPISPSAGTVDPVLLNSNLTHPTASSSQVWTDFVGATAFSPTWTHTSTSTQVASLAQSHPTFICCVDGCGSYIFVDLSSLREHLDVFHVAPQNEHPLKCHWFGCVCKLTACQGHIQGAHGVHVGDMAKHIWEHHLNFQDACPKCGEVGWASGYSMNRHEKTCAGRKPARCRTCCVLFDSKAALAGHLAFDRCPGRAEMNVSL
jgi:hypothetical protein